mgnify:CR=1 FL=1
MQVEKRNGNVVQFDPQNIKNAVGKAQSRTDNSDDSLGDYVVDFVSQHIGDNEVPHVDFIHELVEDGLMDAKAFPVAREYITYRKEHMPDIFKERIAYKPYEYPNLAKYVDAIQQSYWIVSEYNFTGDVQDFRAVLEEHERGAVKRCMLAISQVEIAVKKFWSRIGDRLPKPEIEEVGASFGESEVRHSRAYSHLLELLGLNSDFESVLEVPAIRKRVEYAQKALSKGKTESDKDYMESILLFSLFIENVSLFSQFLIISQINKEKAALKGMSNVIAATSLEENLHNDFGCEIINIIRKEHPEWFTDELNERLQKLVWQAFDAEKDIIDWIFEDGDFEYLSKDEVVAYIKNRFNTGLEQAGFQKVFIVDEDILSRVSWFDVQNSSTMHTDFFSKRSVNYTKFSQSFDEDDLF